MHSLYISSLFWPANEPEHALHENNLRINPITGWIMDHHFELSDSGPTKTGERDI